MESEKKIACNEDPEVMKDMKYWPIGRTYVFGVGFGSEGPRTVQQPYFKPAETGSAAVEDGEMEALQPNPLQQAKGRHLWAVPTGNPEPEPAEQDEEFARGVRVYLDGARTLDAFQAKMGYKTQHQARTLWARVKLAIQEGA
jgi:hypothetical protein